MATIEDTSTVDAKTGVSFLGRIFGKIQKAPEPPRGLEDHVSYTDTPGSNGTEAAYWYPEDSPSLDDDYFATVPEQHRLLVHWDRPPADVNPQAWYDDRNIYAKLQREKIETQKGIPQPLDHSKPGPMADNPNWIPTDVTRPTAFMNPMGYSFVRPYDQDTEHELNGVHFSLAELQQPYLIRGQAGISSSWNNSYRIDPPSNDATGMFVGDTVANDLNSSVAYINGYEPGTYATRSRRWY